jgi:DNA-binding transcriptional MerR regulator
MIESDSETESEYDVDKKTHKISFNNGSKQEVNKLDKIFDKIKNTIDVNQYHIFINNKIVLSSKGLKSLKEKLKEEFDPPEKNIKCFIVSLGIHLNYKYPLTINCSQYTISPKLSLNCKDDDFSQTFTYREKDLLEYGFSMNHIKSIMKALKKDLVSFENSSSSISSVFRSLESQPKKDMKEVEESIKEVEKIKPVNKLDEIFDKIKNTIDIKQDHIFINNKIVVSDKSLKTLKEKIKKEFDPPEKDIKCFIVRVKINLNYKYPLTINCSQYTITPKLSLVYNDDDVFQTFTYNEKELLEYGFSMDHIKSIMKALKKDLVSFENSSVSISSVFRSLESQPKKYMKEVEESIKEVEKIKPNTKELKELVKADKQHIKYHPSEKDKQELKADEASLLLSPYKYENKSLVKQLYDSINTYPEFDHINKQKIKKYSFVVVD